MTEGDPTAPRRRSTQEIARLFDVAGAEDEAIRQLDGSMQMLHQVQEAKSALKSLSGPELRAAVEFRRSGLSGETA